MAYDTKEVANFLLELANVENKPLTPMKLQKLLYYAHGWSLALTGEPLLNESIQAWKYGPVVPTIYHQFKRFGNDPITSRAVNVKTDGDMFSIEVADLPEGPQHERVRALLRNVWNGYKPLTAIQLSTLTHAPGSPWDQVVGGDVNSISANQVIPDNIIRDYFVASVRDSR